MRINEAQSCNEFRRNVLHVSRSKSKDAKFGVNSVAWEAELANWRTRPLPHRYMVLLAVLGEQGTKVGGVDYYQETCFGGLQRGVLKEA